MARPSKPHLSNGYWRCRVGGRTYHLGRDKRRAMVEFHRLMSDHLRTPDAGHVGPHTIAGVCVEWVKRRPDPYSSHRIRTRPLVTWAGPTFLRDVSAAFLSDYYDHLQSVRYRRPGRIINRSTGERALGPERPLSRKTIKNYVDEAAAILRWAHEHGWLATMPKAARVKKPVQDAKDIPLDALGDALATMPGPIADAVTFAVETGARPSELCRLDWRTVNLAARVIVMSEHKTAWATGDVRTLYLTDAAVDILRKIGPKASGAVFLNTKGRRMRPGALQKAIYRRGLRGGTYAMRHTYAQAATDSNVPLEVVQRLMGHTTSTMTARYFKVRDQRAAAFASKLRVLPSAG